MKSLTIILSVVAILIFMTVATVLYGVPTGFEFLIGWQTSYQLGVLIVMGDAIGCLFLYAVGWRKLAVQIYAFGMILKTAIVVSGVPTSFMLYSTDLVPALIASAGVTQYVIGWVATLPRDFDGQF